MVEWLYSYRFGRFDEQTGEYSETNFPLLRHFCNAVSRF